MKPASDPELLRARLLLLKRGDTLNADQHARLDTIFDAHPRLKPSRDAL